jgi:hypothetical protein
VGAQKGHGLLAKIKGKRITPAVNKPADCVRENYTIRRTTNSLQDAENFAECWRSIVTAFHVM